MPEEPGLLQAACEREFARGEAVPVPEPGWLSERRRSAWARFAQRGLPAADEEEWRHVNLAPLAATPCVLPAAAPSAAGAPRGPRPVEGACATLVFLNGRFIEGWSSLRDLPSGIRAGSLRALLASDGREMEADLGRHAPADHPFVALNTAFLSDGAYLFAADGAAAERPIHCLFLAEAGPEARMVHPRLLVRLGRGSRLTILEQHAAVGEAPAGMGAIFTNAVSEAVVGDEAVLEHCRLEEGRSGGYHIGTMAARVGRGAVYASHVVTVGAGLARLDVSAVLAGEGAEARLNGVYIADGRQGVDHHTVIDHAEPHGQSFEVYKGVLDGEARAVFNGKIIVRPGAQKTDAKQTNKNLLLSEGAEVNTKPELQIFADDVRCTHGATVGPLDDEAVFYLRARGLGEAESRRLLTRAFATDVLQRIGNREIAAYAERVVIARLSSGGGR